MWDLRVRARAISRPWIKIRSRNRRTDTRKMRPNLVRVLHLAVILRFVTDDLPGVRDAPELPGVVRDAVEDLERDAVAVAKVRRVQALDDELRQIARTDVSPQIAVISHRIAEEASGVDLPRRADPELNDLQRPTHRPT